MTGTGKIIRHKPTAADLAVGRQLRRLRLAAGLMQAQIADALGVSYQQASKYEIGETRISSTMMLKLREVLGCDPNTPFGWKGPVPPRIEADDWRSAANSLFGTGQNRRVRSFPGARSGVRQTTGGNANRSGLSRAVPGAASFIRTMFGRGSRA